MKHRAPIRPRQRSEESGFALLFVFLLAAGIAISLMMQVPRFAFETARDREEMLIERGEQYKRGISLFFRKTNRLPQKIEDLENTNNIRFLRRRYKDPMTGKDEWRIIHAGPGGALTDSLIKKGPGAGDAKDGQTGTQSGQNFGANPGNTVGSGTVNPGDEPQVNAAVLRRPSDRVAMPGGPDASPSGIAGASGFQGQPIYPGQPSYPAPGTPNYTGNPIYPGQPGYPQTANLNPLPSGPPVAPNQPIYPGQPGYPAPGSPNHTGNPIYPGQPGYPSNALVAGGQGQPIFPGQPGYPQPGTPGYTGQPIYPGQPGYPSTAGQLAQAGLPIYPGQPGYPAPGTPNYTGQPIYPGQPGYPGAPQQGGPQPGQPYNPMTNVPGAVNPSGGSFNQPGMPQQGANNQAVGMIDNLLRNPRQAPPGVGGAFGNTGMQGGIAGVASNFKGPSIKIYKERQKYQEWEFVYDIKEDPYLKRGGAGQAPTGNPLGPNQPNQPTPNKPGQFGR